MFVRGRMVGRVIVSGLAVVKTLNYDTFRAGWLSFMRLFVRLVTTGYPLGCIQPLNGMRLAAKCNAFSTPSHCNG